MVALAEEKEAEMGVEVTAVARATEARAAAARATEARAAAAVSWAVRVEGAGS